MMFRQRLQAAFTGVSEGYTLLLAMVITSAVITGASAVAGIVISEIRQTRDLGNSLQAQVAAERDVEQSLFVARKAGEAYLERGTFVVGDVTRQVDEAPPARPFKILENDFAVLSIPDGFSGAITIPRADWQPGANCTTPEESWIEVSRITWDPSSGTLVSDNQPRVYSHAQQNISLDVALNTVEMRIRALYCDIDALRVFDLPSRVRVRSTARVGGVSQTVEIAVPRFAPAAGLFDFVIFSECDISKGTQFVPC